MRYSAQIRAARALLGWSQGELAQTAGIGLATLQRIEQNDGIVKGNFSTAIKIQNALEHAGNQLKAFGTIQGARPSSTSSHKIPRWAL